MEQYTPMMRQYLTVKENYQDALVFYRLGDFYELFFDDAKVASKELDLVLTGRAGGTKERIPMCGVPHHAATGYIQKLIEKGYKVAIVEQLEDPSTVTGIVKRDVVRIITPGTVLELLDDSTINYIASVVDYQYGLALAICDISTGETILKSIKKDGLTLVQQLHNHNISEIVVHESFSKELLSVVQELSKVTVSYCQDEEIPSDYQALITQEEHYYLKAYGILINYLLITQKREMTHLKQVELDNHDLYLEMDYATKQNLEIVTSLRSNTKNETLWGFLDHTKTAMGSRLLKKWLERPLINHQDILKRQSAITYFIKHKIQHDDLKGCLNNVYDLERLVAKIAYGNANALDCLRVQKTLVEVPEIFSLVSELEYPEFKQLDLCSDLAKTLENAFVKEPPLTTREGGMFQDGYNKELDHYRQLERNSNQLILELEAKEREKTGIKNLKVGYNRVFGYFLEVSKGNRDLIKEEHGYTRKQTLANSERFINSELKELEDEILHAKDKAISIELKLFNELQQTMKSYAGALQQLSLALATIDVLSSLSDASSKIGYVKPEFNDQGIINIIEGRHPILEELMAGQKYVSNSLEMDNTEDVWIITGPNMGGKSTFIRQNALIVIMAQIGCYVPANKCQLTIFDKLFTRIGASDDILSGQSTFMVEMSEANQALQYATKKSLILFDEIGRGTSTYDGMALAQAMIEYIASSIKAKTLFSTHYHEITALEESLDNISNHHVQVFEEDNHVTFLYRVTEGKADKSYGINVARLAKLPNSVIERATSIQAQLEDERRYVQQSLQVVEITKIPTNLVEIEEIIKAVEVNHLTPLEALQLIADLKDKVDKNN